MCPLLLKSMTQSLQRFLSCAFWEHAVFNWPSLQRESTCDPVKCRRLKTHWHRKVPMELFRTWNSFQFRMSMFLRMIKAEIRTEASCKAHQVSWKHLLFSWRCHPESNLFPVLYPLIFSESSSFPYLWLFSFPNVFLILWNSKVESLRRI